MSERRWKKLLRYVEENADYKKIRSYIKKHDLEVVARLENVGSLLHVACRCGHELLIRYRFNVWSGMGILPWESSVGFLT